MSVFDVMQRETRIQKSSGSKIKYRKFIIIITIIIIVVVSTIIIVTIIIIAILIVGFLDSIFTP